jgi:hypothetical protein
MEISVEAIQAFMSIWKGEFGEDLPEERAKEIGIRLLQLVWMLTQVRG